MSDEVKEKEVKGEDVVEDDAPSVEKIEGMTPEERTEVIHGADPETVTDPEPDEGEDGKKTAEGETKETEDVPGEPLSDDDLKKLSPEDPGLPPEARQRHPALKEERRKRRQTDAQNKKLKKQIEQMGEDFEELKVSLEKGAQPPSDPTGGAPTEPDFLKFTQEELDSMTPGQYYDRFNQEWQRREKTLSASIIEELQKQGVVPDPESVPPEPALMFENEQHQKSGLEPSIDLQRAGVNITEKQVQEVEEEFGRTEAAFVRVTAQNNQGQPVSFEVFDRAFVLDIDQEAKERFGTQIWDAMWRAPDASLPEDNPLRNGGLLKGLNSTDYPAYLAILAAPDPVTAMGVKFRELYEKTGGNLKLPPTPAPAPAKPAAPVPDDEPPDPVGLSPGSTTGGAIQGGAKQVLADEVSAPEYAKMTKDQREQAIREGVVDLP